MNADDYRQNSKEMHRMNKILYKFILYLVPKIYEQEKVKPHVRYVRSRYILLSVSSQPAKSFALALL